MRDGANIKLTEIDALAHCFSGSDNKIQVAHSGINVAVIPTNEGVNDYDTPLVAKNLLRISTNFTANSASRNFLVANRSCSVPWR